MNKGWETMRLEDVLKLEYGKSLSDDKRKSNGKYPVYGANGEKGRTNEFYYDKKTIIVGRKGSAGEINLTEEKFWPLDVTYFVTFDEKKYNLKFLFYLLSLLELPKLAKGIKPGINRNEVYDIITKFPPLPEQKRIVSILDKAFAAIDKAKTNTEKNLQNAKELFESYLQNVFANPGEDWEEKLLGDVVKDVQYGTSSKSKPTGKIPVLRMGNIQNRNFVWNDLVYTTDKNEIEKYLLKSNDVLFNRTNSPELVGKAAIYKEERPAIYAGYLIRINRKEELLDADFLNYYLNCRKIREYGFSVMTSSVNQANINGTKLKEYPINLPPLKIQKRIVVNFNALLEETKKLETIYQQKLNDLEELKKSILQKAFAGELTTAKELTV